MLDQIAETLGSMSDVLKLLLLCLILVGLIYWQWQRVSLFLKRVWYELPVIGALASLSRDDQKDGSSSWYRSERELCGDFYKFYPKRATRGDYLRATSYLNKAQELGRKPFPIYGWPIVIILLVSEALSFGVLLASYIAQSATLSQQGELGYLAAAVLAIVMLIFTHNAGRELHANKLRSKAREWYATRPEVEKQIPLRPNTRVGLSTDEIDNADPIYNQLASRLDGGKGGKYLQAYIWTVGTLLAVVLIAFGSFYVRSQLLNEALVAETTGGVETTECADIFDCLGKETGKANEQARGDGATARTNASIAAFGVLSVLFMAMQAVGVGMGYFFGFSGNQSKEAWKIQGPYGTAEEFERAQQAQRDELMRIAQSKLQRLQTRIGRTATSGDFQQDISRRSFSAYVDEQQEATRRSNAAESAHQSEHESRAMANANARAAQSSAAPTDDSDTAMRQRVDAELSRELAAEREAQYRAEAKARLRGSSGEGRI